MTHYRDMKQPDIVCDPSVAEDIPQSRMESVKISIVDGDPFGILTVDNESGAATIRMSAHDAKELGMALLETGNYLTHMSQHYNPQPF